MTPGSLTVTNATNPRQTPQIVENIVKKILKDLRIRPGL
jgi:hypothetical protein